MQSGSMQLGSGYSASGMIGTAQGTPADITQYTTIEYYIGTGAEGDTSYMKVNGVEVVGEAGKGETLTVTRDDFTDGKAYLVFQTLGTRTIYASRRSSDRPRGGR